MAEWLATYGYPLLFVGAVIEGETFLLIAAVMARNGPLELPLVMGVATAGALSGDVLFFVIGKTRGAAFIEKRPRWQRRVSRLNPLLRRFKSMMGIDGIELEPGDESVSLGDLEALQGVVKFPVRIKCAVLSWNTLAQALDEASADA